MVDQEAAAQPRLQITLTLSADEGRQVGITVEGSSSDDLTAVLGLLEFCKLRIMASQSAPPAPQAAAGGIMPGRVFPFVPDLRGRDVRSGRKS